MQSFVTWLESSGSWAPWGFLGLFVLASMLMVWRLEALSKNGFEGTVLGTLVMPYCSGIGNLVFVFVLGSKKGAGQEVITNSLVNNVTNLTLLIGLPTVIWGMNLFSSAKPAKAAKAKKGKKDGGGQKEHQINRLSLMLTLTAALFFTCAVWVVASDRKIDFRDGLILVGLFLFWQSFHIFEVLKNNVRESRSFGWMLPLDLLLLAVGAWGVYLSTDWLVNWVSSSRSGFISVENLGWLSGWLMVLPNAILAFYYSRRGNPEVVYTSQVGDGHICIPLCIGISALFGDIKPSAFFETGMQMLLAAGVFHLVMVAVFGRMPRFVGWLLLVFYVWFVASGLAS